ncbi:hypothetical protein P3T18_001199 [Paraburkholderia sp. GAS199]|uniref:hypothetical protein n=1 Tax=Paraburkholderia sp. GAS199 TaxID=3035126 RepID=UPI003D1F0CB5
MKRDSKLINAREPRIEATFELELAVGASHVASMLHVASRTACIEDLVQRFVRNHGRIDLNPFLEVLAEKLDARANPDGAFAVRHYAAHGVVSFEPVASVGVRPIKRGVKPNATHSTSLTSSRLSRDASTLPKAAANIKK